MDTRHTPKSLRARLGLTMREVAERTGVSARCIADVEAGKDPSLSTLTALAPVLGVTREALIEAVEVERARRAGRAA